MTAFPRTVPVLLALAATAASPGVSAQAASPAMSTQVASPAASAQAAPLAGDAAAGGMAFLQCSDCHSTGTGAGVGPGLKGIVGRRAGAQAGFRYSEAMARSRVVWDAKTLDAFLANPQAVVPGTSMAFPGDPDAADRANLVAYLATLR